MISAGDAGRATTQGPPLRTGASIYLHLRDTTLVAMKSADQNEYFRATWTWRAGDASPSAPKSAVPN